MPKLSVLKVLTDYFNTGDGKRPLPEWSKEIKALSTEKKRELAELAAPLLGVELLV